MSTQAPTGQCASRPRHSTEAPTARAAGPAGRARCPIQHAGTIAESFAPVGEREVEQPWRDGPGTMPLSPHKWIALNVALSMSGSQSSRNWEQRGNLCFAPYNRSLYELKVDSSDSESPGVEARRLAQSFCREIWSAR